MSRDTSPPSGYRLDNPARTGGGAGAAAPERQLPSNPSWLKVISTTLRLWLRRRVLHVPDAGRVGSARRGRLAVLLATAVEEPDIASRPLFSEPFLAALPY